jgi:hypothetical protein
MIPSLASYFQSSKDAETEESSVEDSKETEQIPLLRKNDSYSSYNSIEELFTSRSNEPSCTATPHSSLVFDLSLSDIKKSLVDKNRFTEKRQDKIKNLTLYEISKSGEARFRRFSARQLLNDLLDEIDSIDSEEPDAVDASDPLNDDSMVCPSPSKKKKKKPHFSSLHNFLLKSRLPYSNNGHHSSFSSSSNRKNNSKNEGTQSISIKDIRKFDPRFSSLDSSSLQFIAMNSSPSSSSLSSLSYESSIIIRKHVVLLITVTVVFFVVSVLRFCYFSFLIILLVRLQ